MNIKYTLTTLAFFLFTQLSHSQAPRYEIKGHLENYSQDSIFLGYYYGDKQYLLDTATVENGDFQFSEDSLKEGVYLVVMPPDNRYFQIIVDAEENEFSFSGDLDQIEETIEFTGSSDNELFYKNLRYISTKRKEVEALNAAKDTLSEADQLAVDERLKAINDEVTLYQKSLVEANPGYLTSALIRSGFLIDIPEYTGTQEEINTQQYRYYKKHYFDHVNLSDERLLRAPKHIIFDRVNYYLEKLTPQHPDSIIQSIDYLLHEMEGAEEIYRYYLIKFLNDYAQSKIVGMDAVYVHLALNYYAKDKAPWVEDAQLEKIIQNAREAEPTLIGKFAPNVKLQQRDSTDITLYDIRADYTIVVFWAHDCSHCKESMPKLKDFYEKRGADLGIKVFSVCTKVLKDEPPCWEFVDERQLDTMDGWINVSDQNGGRSFMHSLFNIKKTPKLFILDKDKKIISKDLGPEQLGEFFDQIIKPQN
ncbi:MAG: DUF5106 domain-containing protein [Saprospiraceae bacterium]|nr:DUF5106 domain-containing protein [Saprospiraceae bacterium]